IYHENMSQFDSTPHTLRFTPSRFHAVVLLNRLNTTSNITLDFKDLFGNALSPHPPYPVWTVYIRDLWLHEDLGKFNETWQATNVPGHGVRMVTVLLDNTTNFHY
ncbi:unnamed protein product, partial [Adineta steineri]